MKIIFDFKLVNLACDEELTIDAAASENLDHLQESNTF